MHFLKNFDNKLTNFIKKAETTEKNKKIDYLFIFFLTVIILFFFVITIYSYNNFIIQSGDTAIAEQALWNTIKGNWFHQSFLGTSNNFREHLNFIQFLFLPFYYVIPHTFTLYLIIHLSYLIATILLFLYLRKKLGYFSAVILSLFFLLQPISIWQNIGPMHVVAVSGPLLLISLILYEKKKFVSWLILTLAIAFSSEFLFPTMIFLGFLSFWEKRSWKWILPPILSGFLMFLFAKIYITIGCGNIDSVIKSFFQQSKLLNQRVFLIISFLLPVGFIPPFFSRYSLLLIPTILLSLFVMHESRLNPGSHLFTIVPPILTFILIDIISKISIKTKKLLLYIPMISASAFVLLFVSFPSLFGNLTFKAPRNLTQMKKAVTLVEDNKSLTASRIMSYHLSRRKEFFLINNMKKTDYIVFNLETWDAKNGNSKRYVETVLHSNEYETIMNDNNIVVLKKRIQPSEGVVLE